MKAVIYTRVSTDRQRESSHEDQERNCRRIAQREGWKIVRRFTDHAESGTTRHRAQYQAMLEAAKAGEFDVLLMDELSRLSRDFIEPERAIRALEFAGVRIVTADGYDSLSQSRRLHRRMKAVMNAELIEAISHETHRGQEGVVLKGQSAGGKAYGYRSKSILDAHGEKVGAKLVINEPEAKVVRGIFKLYASGWSPRRIADELNRRRVPSPGAGWLRKARRRDGKWLASAINGDQKRGSGLLNNRLYEGVRVWNRTRRDKDPETDRKVAKRRGAAEHVTVPVPHLRIVPELLWRQVKARQQRQADTLGKRVKGGLQKRRIGRAPKYLFTGILRCGVCGSNAVISGEYQKYICASRANGGEHACSNNLRVSRDIVETRVLEELRADLSDPAVFQEFERETRRVLRERRAAKGADQKARAQRRATLERTVANVADAIERGGLSSPALAKRLTEAEAELEAMADERQEWEMTGKVADVLPRALGRYQALLKDLNMALAKDADRARGLLQEYFEDGVVKLEPNKKHTALDAVYRIDGRRLFKSLTGQATIRMVAGARLGRYSRVSLA